MIDKGNALIRHLEQSAPDVRIKLEATSDRGSFRAPPQSADQSRNSSMAPCRGHRARQAARVWPSRAKDLRKHLNEAKIDLRRTHGQGSRHRTLQIESEVQLHPGHRLFPGCINAFRCGQYLPQLIHAVYGQTHTAAANRVCSLHSFLPFRSPLCGGRGHTDFSGR